MRKLKLQNIISKVKQFFKKLLSTRDTSKEKSISHKPNGVDVAIIPDNSEQIKKDEKEELTRLSADNK